MTLLWTSVGSADLPGTGHARVRERPLAAPAVACRIGVPGRSGWRELDLTRAAVDPEMLWELMETTALGKRAASRLRTERDAGRVRVETKVPRSQPDLEKEPASFVPNADGKAGVLRFDATAESGELVLILFHEAVHALDTRLRTRRCLGHSRGEEKDRLKLALNRLIRPAGVEFTGEVLHFPESGAQLVFSPLNDTVRIDESKIPEVEFRRLEARILGAHRLDRQDAAVCHFEAEALAYHGQWRFTEQLIARYPCFEAYLRDLERRWKARVGERYLPLWRERTREEIIERYGFPRGLIKDHTASTAGDARDVLGFRLD